MASSKHCIKCHIRFDVTTDFLLLDLPYSAVFFHCLSVCSPHLSMALLSLLVCIHIEANFESYCS